METTIRKFGNSKGAIIPAVLLKELGLDVNDRVDAKAENGRLVIEIIKHTRPKYTLGELLAQCDENAQIPEELMDWDRLEPVGNEI
jgi:antitoxin component of MazEF toxin-antitoxin module